jgi:hypothetical protein
VVEAKRALGVFCYASRGGSEEDLTQSRPKWSTLICHDDGSALEWDETILELMKMRVVVGERVAWNCRVVVEERGCSG